MLYLSAFYYRCKLKQVTTPKIWLADCLINIVFRNKHIHLSSTKLSFERGSAKYTAN